MLCDAAGLRTAALSADSLHALHGALIEQFGENAPDVLYRSGYEWALQDMVRLQNQLQQAIGPATDFWQMDAKFILDSWWTPLADAGWGQNVFNTASLSRGILFSELHGSAVATAFAGSDQPVCHLYAGLFAGALSFFDRTERHAAELQCAACGGTSCVFVIGAGAEVDAAETWRQQGVTAVEITRRLR